jgi:hypothetical protein
MGQRRRSKPHLMNLTLKGMDELELFPSAEARQRALHEVTGSMRWWELAGGIAVTAAAGLAIYLAARELVGWLVPHPGRVMREALDVLRIAITMGGLFLVLRFLHRWGTARALRAKLIACGVPVCASCGYLLRGLAESVAQCPECGRAIDPAVRELIRGQSGGNGAAPEGRAPDESDRALTAAVR